MGEVTKIEWCTHTWSPWIGCTKLTAACDHCYAADMAKRYGWAEFVAGAPRHRTSAAYWKKPLAWNRQAEAAGRSATVFASLCDPFDAEVSDDWRADYMAVIEQTPHLEWLLLTKRPSVARKYFDGRHMPANVRLGITGETQDLLEQRTRELMAIRTRLLPFLSAEPLLGALRLDDIDDHGASRDALRGEVWVPGAGSISSQTIRANRFGWVISGGESGPKARPSHPDWFRSLRDQCQAAGVPFFFKQWGEWLPWSQFTDALVDDDPEQTRFATMEWDFGVDKADGEWRNVGRPMWCDSQDGNIDDEHCVGRVGKKAAGALLDGKEWRQFPT